MTTIRFTAACLLAVAMSGCTTVIKELSVSQASLDYVGEIAFGIPVRNGMEMTVPLGFTGGQWLRNSAICFHHAEARQVGGAIELRVYKSLCGKGLTARERNFRLRGMPTGTYDVFHLDPDGTRHHLGGLKIP